ncbi:MAG: hypothetical protein E6R07_02120 [Nevskiaceae bacterium]|nr:MAG: hypothetical protein E6R07_02120 [Nevskiaceae bacterium]
MSIPGKKRLGKQKLNEAMLLWSLLAVFAVVMSTLILSSLDRSVDTGLRIEGTVFSCDTHRRFRRCTILIGGRQAERATVLSKSAMPGDTVTLKVLRHRLFGTTDYVVATADP